MIKVKGVRSTLVNLRNGVAAQTKAQKEAVMRSMIQDLKEATPVDTGEARDGWRIEGSSIVNDVDHIGSLNEGSSQQAPARFIESTVLAHKDVSPSGIIVADK